MNKLNSNGSILEIKNLSVDVEGKQILDSFNLTINPGEVHAIMGPNGTGKSTLAKVLARHPDYQVTNGSIDYRDMDLLAMDAYESAVNGIFLSFQYPVEIPGVSNIQFLKTSLNSVLKHQGKKPLDAVDFLSLIKGKMKQLQMSEELLSRAINDGFSGGEKKRNEILQLSLLEPFLAILDETDSGLDIDALKLVAQGVNAMKNQDRAFLLITHYQRLLDYVEPDVVHVMNKGKLAITGDKSLPLELEEKGYSWLNEVQ